MLSFLLIATFPLFQMADTTTEAHFDIDEVVVVSAVGNDQKRSAKGTTANIDEHLALFSEVSLIKRGQYASEPTINNMATERISVTIDGMKIFYACTDKMDPVTSYVESGNLQSISLNAGLAGNPQSTGNIGGSLDLKLRKIGFDAQKSDYNILAGYEANGHLQVYGADVAISKQRVYANCGTFFRHADNYKRGSGEEVNFSQFQKFNAFCNIGYKTNKNNIVEGAFIYDCATDVGYPALNMDVAKAKGIITSISFKHQFATNCKFNFWETKLYYNHITHIMDDTHRPNVEIHMDMPGKSSTMGLYSLATATTNRHQLQLNYDFYYNQLFADMTMYPGGAAPMYMVTWPDVGTINNGLALSDNISVNDNQSINVSAKWAWQWQQINNVEGLSALRVFFPNMKNSYYQIIGRVAVSYVANVHKIRLLVGAGWGSRAPTVTEAYGYYLNNTFDQFDYIGNPQLKNESAFEINTSVKLSANKNVNVSVSANTFLFSNYIIGEIENRLSAMTVGAEGVKIYYNQRKANITNASINTRWKPIDNFDWNAEVTYAIGVDENGDNLPLIAPISYNSNISFSIKKFISQISLIGNAKHTQYGEKYAETLTPAYAILNLSVQRYFSLRMSNVAIRIGVENIFDKNYTTYSDWCHIPQKGRNVYANISIRL